MPAEVNRVEMPGPSAEADLLALCERARAGDDRAFERLYRATVGTVHGLCLRMTADHALAEDCTQRTFVRAWQKLHQFRGDSAPGTWLHRIAVNEVLGSFRQERRHRGEAEVVDVAGPDTTPDIDLERAIARLPERPRQVFVLHGVYGYGHEQAAEMLEIAVGTSKAHYHRAREMLRAMLGEDSRDEQGD